MTHLSVQVLSTYLDDEGSDADRKSVEEHLSTCVHCKSRLGGLERVIQRLSALEQASPPAHLGAEIHRFVALQKPRLRPIDRLERHAGTLSKQSSLIPVFAVVIALVLIVFMFASGLQERSRSRTEVVVPLSQGETAKVRLFGQRVFELREGIWIERGWESEVPVRQIERGSTDLRVWFDAEPALKQLLELDDAVWLGLGDELVELVPDDN